MLHSQVHTSCSPLALKRASRMSCHRCSPLHSTNCSGCHGLKICKYQKLSTYLHVQVSRSVSHLGPPGPNNCWRTNEASLSTTGAGLSAAHLWGASPLNRISRFSLGAIPASSVEKKGGSRMDRLPPTMSCTASAGACDKTRPAFMQAELSCT